MAKKPGKWVPQDLRLPMSHFEDEGILALEQELGGGACWAFWKLKRRVAQVDLGGTFWGAPKQLALASGWPIAEVGAFIAALEDAHLIQPVEGGWAIVGWADEQEYIAQHADRSAKAAANVAKRWGSRASGDAMPDGDGYQRYTTAIPAEYRQHSTVVAPSYQVDSPSQAIPDQYQAKPSQDMAPLRGANAPTGARPRAHEADPYLAFDAGQPAGMPSEGQPVPQEQASGTSDGQGHHTGQVKGPPGPRAELSTKLSTPSYPEAFEALWAATPQQGRTRSGKPKAYKAWLVATKRAKPEEIAAGLEAFKASHDWRKEGGHYVPGLHVWLGREVWGEKLEAAPQGLAARQVAPQGKAAPSPEYGSAVTGGALAAVELAKARIAARAAGAIEVEASEKSHG